MVCIKKQEIMSTTSYYLYQKYVSYDGGTTRQPVTPYVYSVDGDGTQPMVQYLAEDPDCGGGSSSYSGQYLTIESIEDNNNIQFINGNGEFPKTISASTDGGQTWTAFTSTSGGTTIATLNIGQKVLLKGENERYFPVPTGSSNSSGQGNRFSATKAFNVYGNIMSLVSGDSFSQATSVSSYAFQWFFYNSTNLISAQNLVLPAITLTERCYAYMFCYCTSLTTAPELPATTLAENCYRDMFANCYSLTTAPELPATTLENSCYAAMFSKCTSLTTAPVLSATTLVEGCYNNMFISCTNLTTAPALPATTLAYNCYQTMFSGCTSLTTAPVLSATTLVQGCYYQMFYGCTNLNYIKCLATDISAFWCTNNWVSGTSVNGTFVKAPLMCDWSRDENGIPANWTVSPDDCGTPQPTDYAAQYLTIESLENNNEIKLQNRDGNFSKTISASTDNGTTWTAYTASSGGTTIATLNSGGKVLLKGLNERYFPVPTGDSFTSGDGNRFTSTGNFNVYGNIMSLVSGDSFTSARAVSSFAFTYFFYENNGVKLVSAENLVLPATTLGGYCYNSMFEGCKYMTTAPSILPATSLVNYCYRGMFSGCNNLTAAPELPATTLKTYSYQRMFYGCSRLNYIKCLATDISASNCTTQWLSNVASSGTFVKNSSMYNWTTGYNGIPSNWTVQDA